MGLSVRQLKEQLTAFGVDFSTCREKVELQQLLEEAEARRASTVGQEAAPPQSALADGGFAARRADGRSVWVEFVDEGDAFCLLDDGTDTVIPESSLVPRPAPPCPAAFRGSFEAARTAAFNGGRLLVAAVRGAAGRGSKPERLQSLALAGEEVISLIGDNAVFWAGSATELRGPHLQQLAPGGAPSVAMVLPLATDAMRVLSHSQENTCDSLVARFVEALERLSEHNEQTQARVFNEAALLRMEQDEEFEASLVADQVAAQQAGADQSPDPLAGGQAACRGEDAECPSQAEASASGHSEAAMDEQLAKRRRSLVDEFLSEPSEVTGPVARLVLRLPSGQRVQRSFSAEDRLVKVRRWAECCPWLPEASGQDLHIPALFELSMAYPRRQFTPQDDEMTLSELGLAPSAALLLTDATA